jgi:hypothetical protein
MINMRYDTPILGRDPMLLTKQEQLSWLAYDGATIVEDHETNTITITYNDVVRIIKIDDKYF